MRLSCLGSVRRIRAGRWIRAGEAAVGGEAAAPARIHRSAGAVPMTTVRAHAGGESGT